MAVKKYSEIIKNLTDADKEEARAALEWITDVAARNRIAKSWLDAKWRELWITPAWLKITKAWELTMEEQDALKNKAAIEAANPWVTVNEKWWILPKPAAPIIKTKIPWKKVVPEIKISPVVQKLIDMYKAGIVTQPVTATAWAMDTTWWQTVIPPTPPVVTQTVAWKQPADYATEIGRERNTSSFRSATSDALAKQYQNTSRKIDRIDSRLNEINLVVASWLWNSEQLLREKAALENERRIYEWERNSQLQQYSVSRKNDATKAVAWNRRQRNITYRWAQQFKP